MSFNEWTNSTKNIVIIYGLSIGSISKNNFYYVRHNSIALYHEEYVFNSSPPHAEWVRQWA